jgi:creatinine amidohydrolase
MRYVLIALFVCAACSCGAQTRQPPIPSSGAHAPPIYQLGELTWQEVDGLDRARTLFILPVGMLEQHGPHLPVGADTLAVVNEASFVAEQVSRASAAWNIVMMPTVAYGHSGANQLGDLPIHPGTYALRQSTFRAVLADIGSQLAENGFRWIFVLNGHGAPSHSIATDEACDFVSERFGVTMLNVSALFRADPQIQSRGAQMNRTFFSDAQIASFGMDVHAGVAETAGLLAVRPDLVSPDYRTLPSQAGTSIEELRAIATAPGWQGYLSSPAHATPEYGAAVQTWWIDGLSELILQAIRGEDMFARPRAPETLPPPIAPIIERALASEEAFEAELDAWLSQHRR